METLQKIATGITLFFSLLIFTGKSNAQIKAAFSASSTTLNCPTQTVDFSDSSKGNPTSWIWDFGDRTGSTVASPNHRYQKSGRYTVTLVVTDALSAKDSAQMTIIVLGPTVQYSKTIDTTCSLINVKFSSKATGGDPLFYNWDFGDGTTKTLITSSTIHSYKGAATYPVRLTVRDTSNCTVTAVDTLVFGAILSTLTSSGAKSMTANRECTDQFGWTNYYNNNGTPTNVKDDIILLSIRKNGNSIGTIGDGRFQVKLDATENAGTNQGIFINSPLISESGYYAMNRYWNVTPTRQPATSVGVRFYFNGQDVADVNGSYPDHNATLDQLVFYKVTGGNPDPTTLLSNATDVTSINYGSFADETHWTYTYTGPSGHCAEFMVNSFSGGGGGITRTEEQALPIKMVSFHGKAENNAVRLNWTVASEINVDRFDIQASVDGKTFTTIGKVQAKGNSTSTTEYAYNDMKLNGEKVKFYKIITVDRDGQITNSEVIRITFGGVTNTISLYPVPASNYLNISSKSIINKMCTVEVYNSIGLKVMQVNKYAPGNSFQINTSSLPNGRYRTIILNNNNKIADGNFMILR